MNFKKAVLIPTHVYSYHSGEVAQILEVVIVKPSEHYRERPCYLVEYPDGSKDFIAIEDTKNYKIVSKDSLEE